MPRIVPIRSVRYPQRELSGKLAPPYDVLDEGPKRKLLERDPCNIVAIDLPVTPPKTVGPDEAYEQAADTYRGWLARGVLARDAELAVFAYEQSFSVGGQMRRRRGFFAGVGIEEFNRPGGGIFRHEHTIRGGVDDRLKLMRATRAQLSPVLGIYEDPAGEVERLVAAFFAGEPDAWGQTSTDGVEHKLWAVRDRALIAELGVAFESRDVFIADGHHRYTTVLGYAGENPGRESAGVCLFVLISAQDPGLEVLPTHRVLHGLEGFDAEKLRRAVEDDGRLRLAPLGRGDPADGPEGGPFAAVLHDAQSGASWRLMAREEDPLGELLPDKPPVWRRLDVAILHELFVDRILRPHFGGARISYKYYGDSVEFEAAWRAGGLGVRMRATPLRSVIDVSRASGVMPPKSTFFYPKLATGLVINPLD